MEAKFGEKINVYSPVETDTKKGKRTLEWDLNDWKWDGDLFLATPLNPAPSDCMSRQLFPLGPELPGNANVSNSSSFCSGETNPTIEREKRELEKKRRIMVVPDQERNDESGPLNLNLGDQVYPIAEGEVDKQEGKSGKKSKPSGTSQPVCQVEGCRADLSIAKDYHRRHKVCATHSKASKALVGKVWQRFCQQCSRFHVLQEFDEGKRSCRRRLDGHNKRRRKTHPETSANVASLTDESSAGFVLDTFLRILANVYTNGSNQSKDLDLLSQLLRNLADVLNGSNITGLLQRSRDLLNVGTSVGIPEKDPSRAQESSQVIASTEAQRGLSTRKNQYELNQTASASQLRVHPTGSSMPDKGNVVPEACVGRRMLCHIDLNNVHNDLQDCTGDAEIGHGFGARPFWAEQPLQNPSPPQTSGNSDSNSGQSSSSGSETQCRTDRIVFKLFGKDPNDLPHLLRTQILKWLSHSPADIEGYIRPGCIILTIYVRLDNSLWEEFGYDMSSSLSRLLNMFNDPFWKTGWIYTRVQQHAAFICDGRVVLDTPLPFKSHRSQISSISPIAVPAAETVQLVVRGSNLSGPTSRLLCAIEGKYLVQESCYGLLEGTDTANEQDVLQSLSFCCSIPKVIGRGFIEVEDYGLTGCFFPFIVAEPEICSEICMLEKVIELVGTHEDIDGECGKIDARNRALKFIDEIGWLLHRYRLRFERGQNKPQSDLFPFERLKWLVEFSMDHDWCAVLRKLLDLLYSGIVDTRVHASIENALSEMAILHTAVRRNSRQMVEFLLKYIPKKVTNTLDPEEKYPDYGPSSNFLFRPDVVGAGGLTPLHIAASSAGSENVLDALLEDPGMVGLKAWESARDSTGLTPNDYAGLRGHYSYIRMVQKKLDKKLFVKHVVVDIPRVSDESNQKQTEKPKSAKFDSFYTEKLQVYQNCKLCEQTPDCRFRGATVTCRPAMLSLVAIAVVCVCTALLFKSLPRVGYVFGPFRWESLKYGAM